VGSMAAWASTAVAGSTVASGLKAFQSYQIPFSFKERDVTRVLFVLLLLPTAILAQSPFDGTWIAKLDTIRFPKQPTSARRRN
jgi:hypothetical protein